MMKDSRFIFLVWFEYVGAGGGVDDGQVTVVVLAVLVTNGDGGRVFYLPEKKQRRNVMVHDIFF